MVICYVVIYLTANRNQSRVLRSPESRANQIAGVANGSLPDILAS